MKQKSILAICIGLFLNSWLYSQITCTPGGNLFVYANYDGGVLNINCDVNIPNLKIGICTYEPVTINLTGPFVGNVTEVRYAGYVSTNNFHCVNSPTTTTITGVSSGITSVNFLPPATLSNPNGYGSIVCAYSCNTGSNQGGCNTADQIKAYFQSTMSATLVSYHTQYGCWSSAPYNLSTGGNCCNSIVACATTANAGPDQSICLGGTATLSGSGTSATTYSWSPSTGLGSPNSATTTANPTVTTTYILTASDGGSCSDTDTVTVTVTPLAVTASPITACSNDAPFALTGGSPTGGTYTGSFISANQFSPTLSGPGTHSFTYTYTDVNGCYGSATSSVLVHAAPTPSFVAPPALCSNAAAITLNGGSPSGGNYSGPGVSGNLFDPALAGAGSHSLAYTIVDNNGCVASAQASATVFAAPTVNFSPIPATCEGDAPITLSASPSGGTFSGNGVSGNQFSPNSAGLGTTTLSYTFTDANGCTGIANQNATVQATPATPVVLLAGTNQLTTSPLGDSTAWYLNGSYLGSGDTLAAIASGNYSAIVWVNGCPSDTSQSYFHNSTALMEEWEGWFTVSPNPAQNWIQLEPSQPGSYTVDLFDLSGKKLTSFPAASGSQRLSLTMLPAGTYLLTIQQNSQRRSMLLVRN